MPFVVKNALAIVRNPLAPADQWLRRPLSRR
jgi:hypothetical protein